MNVLTFRVELTVCGSYQSSSYTSLSTAHRLLAACDIAEHKTWKTGDVGDDD